MKETVNDRLRNVIKGLGISQAEFGRNTGIQSGHLSQLLKTTKTLSSDILMKICNVFPQVNINYLLYGQGEPTTSPKTLSELLVMTIIPQNIDALIYYHERSLALLTEEMENLKRGLELLKLLKVERNVDTNIDTKTSRKSKIW